MNSALSVPFRETPHVLLVDHDEDTRKMYAEYLMLAAYTIDEAADGRDALAKALTAHPDVVVTETQLPGINGCDLCSLLRRDPATASIRIVVVTADAYPADVSRAQHAGADAVLVKPCLPERLLEELRRLRQRSRVLQTDAERVGRKSTAVIERSEAASQRSLEVSTRHAATLSRAHHRHDTTTPPAKPPDLICPQCEHPLTYQHSHIGGVSAKHPEQWDYLHCENGCGTFQYRRRTRKLRYVS